MKSRMLTSVLTFIKTVFANYGVEIVFIVGISTYIYTKYYYHPFQFDQEKALEQIQFPETLKVDMNRQRQMLLWQMKNDSINDGDYDESQRIFYEKLR